MFRRIILLLVAVLLATTVAAAAFPSVTVTVEYPAATMRGHKFTLRGSAPLSWTAGVEMQSVGANKWSATFSTTAANWNTTTRDIWLVDYKILVDDQQWSLGRNMRVAVSRSGPAMQTARACPFFFTTSGQKSTIQNFPSPQLVNCSSRNVFQYVPPNVLENTACTRFDDVTVLLMQDGQNLSPDPGPNNDASGNWSFVEHLEDAMLGNSAMGPATSYAMIVGPWNCNSQRIYEMTTVPCPPYSHHADGEQYMDWMEQTLIPQFAKQFPMVDFSNKNVLAGGSSLGGLISCIAAIERPQTYAGGICMSSSFWWANQHFLKTYVPKLIARGNSQNQRFYLDTGDAGPGADDRIETSRVVTKIMAGLGSSTPGSGFEIGSTLFWALRRGQHHNEDSWSARLPEMLQLMLGRDGLGVNDE